MAVSAGDAASRTKAPAISTCAPASPAAASPSPAAASPSALVLAKPAGASTPPADHALHGRALALVFFGLLLAMLISSLSETIASTALSTIVGDLNGVGIMQWVSTAYILFVDAGHAHLRQAGRPCRPQAPAHGGARPIRSGQDDLRPSGEHGACSSAAASSPASGAAASSSCPRRRSPTWCRRASSAPTWASSAPCSPCRMCWGRFWAAGSSR